jgi:hypothetical protein
MAYQLCHAHFKRNINKVVKALLNSEKHSEDEKAEIEEYKKKIFKILDAETYGDAESLFNSLLKEKNNIPYKLRRFVDKDLKHDFERYMGYLKDGNIEKTTNKLENFYRQTFPRAIKKLLTSIDGKKDFLSIRNHNWNKKFGKIAYQLNCT